MLLFVCRRMLLYRCCYNRIGCCYHSECFFIVSVIVSVSVDDIVSVSVSVDDIISVSVSVDDIISVSVSVDDTLSVSVSVVLIVFSLLLHPVLLLYRLLVLYL